MTAADFLDVAKMVAVVTGWVLLLGAVYGLLVAAGAFCAWFYFKLKDEADK